MKHVIFISSEGGNVGKSTTARLYSNHLNNKNIPASFMSFATPIKQHCNGVFSILFPNSKKTFMEYYESRESKESKISDYEDFGPLTLSKETTFRSFINDTSDEFKSTYGPDVWAQCALYTILNNGASVTVIDDFRTLDEYNYLIKALPKTEYKTFTVKLLKEDADKVLNSSYENLLKDFNHDIDFEFLTNYSNLNQLFDSMDSRRL